MLRSSLNPLWPSEYPTPHTGPLSRAVPKFQLVSIVSLAVPVKTDVPVLAAAAPVLQDPPF